jgi:hypothetical protein
MAAPNKYGNLTIKIGCKIIVWNCALKILIAMNQTMCCAQNLIMLTESD